MNLYIVTLLYYISSCSFNSKSLTVLLPPHVYHIFLEESSAKDSEQINIELSTVILTDCIDTDKTLHNSVGSIFLCALIIFLLS